jgi:serine/threonine-protein kinase
VDLARLQLAVKPNDPATRISLALYLAKLRKKEEALAEMSKALEMGPTEADVIFKSALIHELNGNRAAALEALQTAIQKGYSVEQISKEPELTQLRSDPRYRLFGANHP